MSGVKLAAAEPESGKLAVLLEVRQALRAARAGAPSPGVARALQMADYYLFLAMTYLGYTDKLFPEEE
jgi:hypothetical protein